MTKCGRHGGVIFSVLDSGWRSGFKTQLILVLCSWADHSTLTMLLSTQMYPGLGTGELSGKPDEMQGGNPVMDQHPIQGGVVILLVALR